MKSNRKQVIRELEDKMEDKHKKAGDLVLARARGRILEYGLYETGMMLGELSVYANEEGFWLGFPPMDPPYPAYLHQGFRHWISGELVGPYPYLTDAINDSKSAMRQIYEG